MTSAKMPNAKPILPPLKTPKSASFPSELHDDCPSSISDAIKQEEELSNPKSTPITPGSIPSAYKEFLEAFTPIFSPASAGVSFKSPFERPAASPTSQPASALSGSFSLRGDSARSPTISLPPPTPASAAVPRKGHLAPRRLRNLPPLLKYSPTTDSPKSATTFRTPFSPCAPEELGKTLYCYEPPYTAGGKPVSVKQVVTRTVTYKRTQLDAPPKGKRRKCRELKEPKEV